MRPKRRSLTTLPAAILAASLCLLPHAAAQASEAGQDISLPIAGGKITTGYNERGPMWSVDPGAGGGLHKGVDFRCPTGTRVLAIMDGKVIEAGWGPGWAGRRIVVRHPNGVESLYAHLSTVNVSVGEQVSAGEIIGASGESGNVSGAHLHLEVTVDGQWVNPEKYLP